MTSHQDPYHQHEIRRDISVDWNLPIEMDDGVVLRADVFRPVTEDQHPVILTYGAYAKGLRFEEGYPRQWSTLLALQPQVLASSSGQYMNWEVPDPERFVPDGYALVRIDSRGAGWSPGYQNYFSRRETLDIYECIEWAGTQPWSNGRVGMLGVSYYAENQWCVAALKPPHLAAIIPWGGFVDVYRELTYHGGILSEFMKRWDPVHVKVQYGAGDRAATNPITGVSVAGPETLTPEELEANRIDLWNEIKAHPLLDDFHLENTAELDNIDVPLLSVANWGGQGMHSRGNFDGFTNSSSEMKWLMVHGSTDYATFYSDEGVELQKRFLEYFLKGVDNGWDQEPRVMLNIRYPGERFVPRYEHEWPLARTVWTNLYLDGANRTLRYNEPEASQSISYETMGEGLTFTLAPSADNVELTGPMAAKLFISSATTDADLFLTVRLFDPKGDEVTFQGQQDPNTPIANGWLRASHRRTIVKASKPYRPHHPHDRVEPLSPGQIYELDVEIWPTCIVVPAGYRLALTITGCDHVYTGPPSELARHAAYSTRGTGGMTHNDSDDRPPAIFDTTVTLHCGVGETASRFIVPIIPQAN